MTEIRRATADDATACAQIVADWISPTDWMAQGPGHEDLIASMREGFPIREAYVIGAPVRGYVSFAPEEAHIRGFYIADRGKALGRALMDHVKQGRDYLQLNSHAPNTRAHAFYAREGFVKVGQPWRGDDGVDEIRMEWHR